MKYLGKIKKYKLGKNLVRPLELEEVNSIITIYNIFTMRWNYNEMWGELNQPNPLLDACFNAGYLGHGCFIEKKSNTISSEWLVDIQIKKSFNMWGDGLSCKKRWLPDDIHDKILLAQLIFNNEYANEEFSNWLVMAKLTLTPQYWSDWSLIPSGKTINDCMLKGGK